MGFSWRKSFKKALIQVIVLFLSGGLAVLIEEVARLDFANNPTLEGWLIISLFFFLNVLRNWLKQNTTFGRYL